MSAHDALLFGVLTFHATGRLHLNVPSTRFTRALGVGCIRLTPTGRKLRHRYGERLDWGRAGGSGAGSVCYCPALNECFEARSDRDDLPPVEACSVTRRTERWDRSKEGVGPFFGQQKIRLLCALTEHRTGSARHVWIKRQEVRRAGAGPQEGAIEETSVRIVACVSGKQRAAFFLAVAFARRSL